MDERESILSGRSSIVDINDPNMTSIHQSHQTIYHSAEDLSQSTSSATRHATLLLMNDERKNNIQYYSPDDSELEPASIGSKANGGVQNYDEVSPLVLTYDKTDSNPIPNQNQKVTYNQWKALNWARFKDGRPVEFVLAYQKESAHHANADLKRDCFRKNLEKEGLQIEDETSQKIQFMKIHVPYDVLKRYCEIMKIKMPTKKIKDQEHLAKKRRKIVEYIKSFFGFVIIDRNIFQEKEYELQYEYSKEKTYLFDDDNENFFPSSVRIAVCYFILERQFFSEDQDDKNNVGIRKLLTDGVFLDAYPLHDGNPENRNIECQRNKLLEEWAAINKWIKHQPLDYVKEYFGVKIALYFAWIGFYTHMLISASVVGLVTFLYGLFTFSSNQISKEICNDLKDTIMCPRCDAKCDYWKLGETCGISKFNHVFDNYFTIFFAIFMSIWATLYLELWKRFAAGLHHRWGVTDFTTMAEHPRAQYLARFKNPKKTKRNVVTGLEEPTPSFWKNKFPSFLCSYSIVFLFIAVSIFAVFGIVIYRMSQTTSKNIFGQSDSMQARLLLMPATAAVINLIVSTILNMLYDYVAVYMTDMEYRRTQTEYDDSLSLKIYLFQFLNYYSSIFYIAFIKGKFPGYPAKYNRIFSLRQEECQPGGCLMELCIQLAIIMVGKQAIGAVTEILIPLMFQKLQEFRSKIGLQSSESQTQLVCCNQWTKDYSLLKWTDRSLFDEYLKMIIQYGFITIFVVAFPLGPLCALLNNIFETRTDAKKFLLYYKRAIPTRVKDIGIWYNVMHVLGKIAVISSAFIIAFSSSFIPRLYYMRYLGNGTDVGYMNSTLAYFNTSHFEEGTAPAYSNFENVTICRYSEYRNPPFDDNAHRYKRNSTYWHIFTFRLAFIILFQNLVSLIQILVDWAIPDVPTSLSDQIMREQYLTNNFIIEEEKKKAKRVSSRYSSQSTPITPKYPPEQVDAFTDSSDLRKRNTTEFVTTQV